MLGSMADGRPHGDQHGSLLASGVRGLGDRRMLLLAKKRLHVELPRTSTIGQTGVGMHVFGRGYLFTLGLSKPGFASFFAI
jgi:hypothetical protein